MIKDQIMDLTKRYFEEYGFRNVSVFIGGSFFFVDSDGSKRFVTGKSDVDVIAVCQDDTSTICAMQHLLPRDVVDAFQRKHYGILNITHAYGIGRNRLQIKLMAQDVYETITSLDPISYRSFRSEPLSSKKPYAFFSSSGMNPLPFMYQETAVPYGYCLSYEFSPVIHSQLFLSDIHSLVLLNTCIADPLGIRIQREHLLERMRIHMQHQDRASIKRLFSYFEQRGLLSAQWLSLLTGIFLKQEPCRRLYQQDFSANKKRADHFTMIRP